MTKASKDPNKIKYVSLVNGRWVYRPYIRKADRDNFDVDRSGFLKPIKLGVKADPWHRVLKVLAVVQEDLVSHTKRDRFTLRWIADKYEQSSDFRALSSASQKKAKTTRRILDHELTINERPGDLGELLIESVTHPCFDR